MASFLRRLAENQVVDAATAVTAETLDGLDPTNYQSAVFGAACAADCPETTTVMSMDIDAPAAGVVKFDYSLSIDNNLASVQPQFGWIAAGDACDTVVIVIIVLPDGAAPGSIVQTALHSDQVTSLSGTTALSVPEGPQTFSLCQLSYSTDINVIRGSLTGVWSPPGSSVPVASAGDVVTFSQEEIDAYTDMLDS